VVTRGQIHDLPRLPGFVALDGDERMGLALYRIADDECELVSLDSLREGIGVGSALLAVAADAAHGAGCRRLWLITTNDNTHALRFYQRRGLRLVAIHRDAAHATQSHATQSHATQSHATQSQRHDTSSQASRCSATTTSRSATRSRSNWPSECGLASSFPYHVFRSIPSLSPSISSLSRSLSVRSVRSVVQPRPSPTFPHDSPRI